MYLNDLLDALSRGEKPDLTKPELLSIFRKQRPLHVFQHVAVFFRLGLRDRGETQEQVATRIGVKVGTVKQVEGLKDWMSAENYLHLLDALCADALYAEGKRISPSQLYKKNRLVKSIIRKGNGWHIEF